LRGEAGLVVRVREDLIAILVHGHEVPRGRVVESVVEALVALEVRGELEPRHAVDRRVEGRERGALERAPIALEQLRAQAIVEALHRLDVLVNAEAGVVVDLRGDEDGARLARVRHDEPLADPQMSYAARVPGGADANRYPELGERLAPAAAAERD